MKLTLLICAFFCFCIHAKAQKIKPVYHEDSKEITYNGSYYASMEKKRSQVGTGRDWWIMNQEGEVIIKFRTKSFVSGKTKQITSYMVRVIFPESDSYVEWQHSPFGMGAKGVMNKLIRNELISNGGLNWPKVVEFVKDNSGELVLPENIKSNAVAAESGNTEIQKNRIKNLKSDVDSNLPLTSNKNPDAIAVVIGNSNYEKAKNVDFAINDAGSIKKYLQKTMGFKEGNIFYIENARKGDFEIYFGIKGNEKGKLFNAIKAGLSDLLIFYSGHGAPGLKDQRGYFVPVECDPQYVELGGYSSDVFYENISKIPSKSTTVIIDACFSGASIYENISPIIITSKGIAGVKNGVVLTSSSGKQVSSWYNEKNHGMFTYFFLKAIHDKNADYNKDKILTLQELFKFISDNNNGVPYYSRRIHGIEQNPELIGDDDDTKKVLIRYSR